MVWKEVNRVRKEEQKGRGKWKDLFGSAAVVGGSTGGLMLKPVTCGSSGELMQVGGELMQEGGGRNKMGSRRNEECLGGKAEQVREEWSPLAQESYSCSLPLPSLLFSLVQWQETGWYRSDETHLGS